ncbi:hypothetical protein WJX84_010855 [Apatococcus fuscideae]|uniref:Uncharacterized protein n=1 Tax=Apatococcus fuscideae TaxID=2026836 RepID=A0AAW1TGK8_9CHLO
MPFEVVQHRLQQTKMFKALCVLCLVTAVLAKSSSPPSSCGTLDLTSDLTQHCFPQDGSHHFVCCVDITSPETSQSPHGNRNPLNDVIKAASKPSSYSWCTCSEEICTQQLGGRVAWNQNGAGWKGFRPPQ